MDMHKNTRLTPHHRQAVWTACRVVVNGQRDFAFILTHYFGQQLILRPIKSTVVACGLPIRRVGVKEGVLAVVSLYRC